VDYNVHIPINNCFRSIVIGLRMTKGVSSQHTIAQQREYTTRLKLLSHL